MNFNLYFTLIICLIVTNLLISITYKLYSKWYNKNYLKYGFLSRFYIYNEFSPHMGNYPFAWFFAYRKPLKPTRFEQWCKYFLKNLGYENFLFISEHYEGSVNLQTVNNNITTYVSTRLYGLSEGYKNINDNYATIGRPEVQKFVGALVHDRIKNGIIITTGDFTSEAIEYIKSLPPEYYVRLIDGITLTKNLRQIRKKEITLNN